MLNYWFQFVRQGHLFIGLLLNIIEKYIVIIIKYI